MNNIRNKNKKKKFIAWLISCIITWLAIVGVSIIVTTYVAVRNECYAMIREIGVNACVVKNDKGVLHWSKPTWFGQQKWYKPCVIQSPIGEFCYKICMK